MAWQPKKVPTATLLATSWFALGLFVVFLLSVALVGILQFWGEWLEQHWSLTFPSPLPTTYWYLFPLIPLGVLLLYFLKLKRRALQVPSTFLWKKSIEDLHVNSLFQWLRRNFLLVLQLLFLMGLGYALADPTHNSEARGRHIILMLDNSASMNATDETPTRLELARKQAHERVDALDPSDQAMVIAFNSEAAILQSYTNNKNDLHRAVDRIEPTHRPTSLEQALALAEGQANPRQSGADFIVEQPGDGEAMRRTADRPDGVPTDVYIFSDGRFPDMPDFDRGKLNLRLLTIGHSTKNVGIIRTTIQRSEELPDTYDLSVQIANFDDQPVRDRLAAQLEVFSRGVRQDRQQEVINLAPRQVQDIPTGTEGKRKVQETPGLRTPQPITVFTFKDPGNGYVRVSLVDRNTGSPWVDDFPLDNTAWLAITPVRRARVLRIGGANDILDAILKAGESRDRAVIKNLAPDGFFNDPEYQAALNSERFDLVIFDRCAPASGIEMPQANTLFVGAAPPLGPQGGNLWERMEPMQDLYIKEFLHSHPLFRGLETLQGMSIYEARSLPKELIPSRASALMETQRDPVLWALGRTRYTDLVMTFPLVTEQGAVKNIWNTNWPRQPAGTLPLFFDNVLLQLGRYKEYEDSIQPGTPKALDFGVALKEVEVQRTDPLDQRVDKVAQQLGKDLVYGNTDAVGLYDVTYGDDGKYRFAVNLFDARESSIQPRGDAQVGEKPIGTEQEPLRQRRELWPWFVLGAIVILAIEWIVYNRRIYV